MKIFLDGQIFLSFIIQNIYNQPYTPAASEIEGVKFYGVPMFMEDCITDRQEKFYKNIPSDTDVLISHSPAYGILDFDDNINYGSEGLLFKLSSLNLKAHLFGHIHAQHGTLNQNDIIFSNGAIMNADYSNLQTPNIIQIEPGISTERQR